MVDGAITYFIYPKKGGRLVASIPTSVIEIELKKEIHSERITFKDYLYSSPPWSEDFESNLHYYNQYFLKEEKIRDKVLEKFDIPKGEDDFVFKKNQISPKSLINFMECFAWVNGKYEAECLVISDTDYDFAIYEISRGFFSSKKRGERVVAFRYSEFQYLSISPSSFSFRIQDKHRGVNGRLDSRWEQLFFI